MELGLAEVVEQPAVVGDVGVELDAPGARVDAVHGPVLAAAVRQVALDPHRADRVEHLAGGGVDESLAADAEHHDGIGRAGGHLAGDAQPGAVELGAPRGAVAQGAEGRAIDLGERDGLVGAQHLGAQRRDDRVDALADAAEAGVLARLPQRVAAEISDQTRHLETPPTAHTVVVPSVGPRASLESPYPRGETAPGRAVATCGRTALSSAEGRDARQVLPEDERVHLVGALVGAHRLEVRGMPDRAVLDAGCRCRRGWSAPRARSRWPRARC